MSQEDPCTEENQGYIRVIGLTNENVIAGRMEYCYNDEWRALGWWDLNDTKVVCRQQLTQTQSGTYVQVNTKIC